MGYFTIDQLTKIDEYIESILIPVIEKEYTVIKYKKVGELFFFLVFKKNDLTTPSKMLLTYKIAPLGSTQSLKYAYMDSSIKSLGYSTRCPNSLLNLIDKTHPIHKTFLSSCLAYQDEQKKIRLERPLKVHIMKALKENTIISTKKLGVITFKGIANSRKGDFKAVASDYADEVLFNVDSLEISELAEFKV